jgi:hypothetical protein
LGVHNRFRALVKEDVMPRIFVRIAMAASALAFAAPALAQNPSPGQGPVATACAQDIEKFCAGKEHGQGAVRACLESNKAKVSSSCATALETTGGGRR